MRKFLKKGKSYIQELTLFPFIDEMKGYKIKTFRKDILASFTVALVAIPQSIAYSLLANLPPSAGLFSAIFGTIFAGIFGSSRFLISGPVTGVSILLQTVIYDTIQTYYGTVTGIDREVLSLQILMQLVLLVGIIQIIASFLHLGRALHYVSRSVIYGYFAGVVTAIIVDQLYPFLGIDINGGGSVVLVKAFSLFDKIKLISGPTLILGLLSLFFFLFLRKRFPKFPSSILMLLLASIGGYFFNHWLALHLKPEDPFHIAVMGDGLMIEKPIPIFAFPEFNFQMISILLPSALAVAMLSLLKAFSVSATLSAKTGDPLKPNQQVFSIGLANIFLSFLTRALPASGSLSRSFVNYQNGAKTRLSAIFSGILVGVLIYSLWPFVKHVPLVSLAALLLVVSINLLDFSQIKVCLRSTKADAMVFFLTFASCLIFRLDLAFFLGILIAIAFYLKKAGEPHIEEYSFNTAGRLSVSSYQHGKIRRVRIIGMRGELSFPMVEYFQNALQEVGQDPEVEAIVLRLDAVYHMDASMVLSIMRLFDYLHSKERYLVISGVSQEVWKVFQHSGIVDKIGEENIFLADISKPQLSTWNAVLHAEELIGG